jgi:putative ABC transport system permease protein
VVAAWALAQFVFEVKFSLAALPLVAAVAIVSTLTVVTGLLMSRGILNHPPLAVLRAEG